MVSPLEVGSPLEVVPPLEVGPPLEVEAGGGIGQTKRGQVESEMGPGQSWRRHGRGRNPVG